MFECPAVISAKVVITETMNNEEYMAENRLKNMKWWEQRKVHKGQ